MLCCPCIPLRKRKKVQEEQFLERRPRHWLRRLFRKNKTGDAGIPAIQEPGPVSGDVPQISSTVKEVPCLDTPGPLVTLATLESSTLVSPASPETPSPGAPQGEEVPSPDTPKGCDPLDRLMVQLVERSRSPSRGRKKRARSAPVALTIAPEAPASRARTSPVALLIAPEAPERKLHVLPAQQLKCRGLPNLGQTCYINSTLQCLFALQPLCIQLLLQEETWRQEPSALLLSSFVGLWCLRASTDRELKAAVLMELKDCIALRNQEFKGNSQNDAHEFLSECLLGLKDIGHTLQMGDVSYQCPVDTLLSFQLQHIRSCRSCGVESRREEISTYLSLQMVAQGTVQNSLELYFSESEVEYRCERCGGQVSSLRCSFYTLPQVLILHLKRFCPFTLTKSMAPLQLEAELQIKQRTEDIAGRCGESPQGPSAGSGRCPAATSTLGGASSSEASSIIQELEAGTEREKEGGSSTYSLMSVLSHIGTNADCGHYTSDCAEEGGLWLSLNDEEVFPTTQDAVLRERASTAYMLFYTRK
ncbi:ubiquitin carboxyl-terminal hydrolase 37-like isoform X2 [Clupea harengus]|uniref:Ubiquitin carboxyl-terminal hydrolase n=1 Tax=Clupea harengus TaxID=7950 RepID=A0A8M1KU43_CLUHA|nr:ubiquitin carboxyl-terminal hydrolase 37-like isoform X2 [Clupea harengus]